MSDQGLVKLLYSSAFDSTVDVGMRIVEDPAVLRKQASTIFGCESESLAPDKNHVGIQLVALGDFEHYGSNRNGDSFPKKACVAKHDTFVKNAHLFRHHRNKDPEKGLGIVKASAYNETMGRIELFVHAHKEKCEDELQKLASEGDIAFSMACKVANDRCSVCDTLRKSSRDPNQCDHVRDNLGKVAEDGTVTCTHNDDPNFFDISFVGRPADRIAWHLKSASADIIDSVKLAESEGIWVPDHVAITSPVATEKRAMLKKLAGYEQMYADLVARQSVTDADRYAYELRKSAYAPLPNEAIERLRECEPADVFLKLAEAGIIMDVDSFFKYAMGLDYGEIAPHMDDVRVGVRGVFSRIEKEGSASQVCNEHMFDISDTGYGTRWVSLSKEAADCTMVGPEMEQRVIQSTVNNEVITLDTDYEKSSNSSLIVRSLSEKYAAYKLAAVRSILSLNKSCDTESLAAIAAVQNLVNQ